MEFYKNNGNVQLISSRAKLMILPWYSAFNDTDPFSKHTQIKA